MKFHGYEPIYEETDDHQILDKVVKLTEDMVGDVSRQEIICGRKAPLLGASFVPKKVRGYWRDEITYARNHPDIVHHIPELLLVWLANCDGRAVQSYPQLINYVLKYTLKPELKSATLQEIEDKLRKNTADDTVVKKILPEDADGHSFQKRCICQRGIPDPQQREICRIFQEV